ncbi:unnamed protein product [Lymnaea stagnalis]|uniref:NADH dehydrogenase [ubiquinone] 1 alpha subcomplex assembly factor 3 n=1 Tax=Lymnaea stagnalis TaxID=6523 RepID=A0AAV2IHB5_LYMST
MFVSFQRMRFVSLTNIRKFTCTSISNHNFDGESYSKSNVSMISLEDETHNYIAAYSSTGFRLASGFNILGPCALFPRAVLHWNVASADKITPESLSLFTILEPKLDILLIGKGDWGAKVDSKIIQFLRSHKINVEILPTEQACSTFNFLNSERRVVAAALIPPHYMTAPQDTPNTEIMLELEELEGEIERIMESFNKHGILETAKRIKEQNSQADGEAAAKKGKTENDAKHSD